jgi:hypothetical protein
MAIINLKKFEFCEEVYSYTIRSFCPFCRFSTKHKIRKYDSLKSLGHHIATEHKTIGNYPFTTADVRELMKNIGVAIHWGVLN